MIHLGDITKISGYTAPMVDCIIGGSPCQDLSIAGGRKGLAGARSGLFMEQVRIVKEMREQSGRTDEHIRPRPRYMVWENVHGAFSSNKGEDFQVVLEELARIREEEIVIPRPEKWSDSGVILGDDWSIAWRVFDAQHWGVPQRRRRICLVCDFDGHSAADIVFNCEYAGQSGAGESNTPNKRTGDRSGSQVQSLIESLQRYYQASTQEREESSGDITIGTLTDNRESRGTGSDDGRTEFSFQERSGKPGGQGNPHPA